jgi:hypothetical protein
MSCRGYASRWKLNGSRGPTMELEAMDLTGQLSNRGFQALLQSLTA